MVLLLAIVNISILMGISWWCSRNIKSELRKLFWPALFLKLAAGVALGIIYKFYYSANDTFFFFTEALDAAKIAKRDFIQYLQFLATPDPRYLVGEARTGFFVKLLSIPVLVTMSNYWISSLYFSLLSFFGGWFAFNAIVKNIPTVKWPAAIGLLFFPSVVFWSSGIIKESVAMAALFFLTGFFVKLWFRDKVTIAAIVLAIISIYVVWTLKYYYVGLFLPLVLTALVVQRASHHLKSFLWEAIVFVGVLTLCIAVVSQLHPNFHLSKIATVVVENNKVFMSISTSEDLIHFYNLSATWSSFIINVPWALCSGLFRPFIWEVNSITQLAAALENIILFFLAVQALAHFNLLKQSPHRLLLLTIIMYSVLLCVFLALSSPNFGTLSRYRVGFLPFLVILLMSTPTVQRLMTRVGFSW